VFRYGIYLLGLSWYSGSFPYATIFVNVLGSFIIGVLWTSSYTLNWTSDTRALIFTGLLGGFTTFSAFALESNLLFRSGESKMALLYIILSVVLGLFATFAGLWAGQRISFP
ncbi:MAG: CrcB protein, partial [Limisphaerales bacterium]